MIKVISRGEKSLKITSGIGERFAKAERDKMQAGFSSAGNSWCSYGIPVMPFEEQVCLFQPCREAGALQPVGTEILNILLLFYFWK